MIPDRIRQFLRQTVRSVWDLEVLLLLKASAPRCWTAAELSQELRGSANMIGDILTAFAKLGLAAGQPDGSYRYAAPSEMDAVVVELQREYAEKPTSVIKEILTTPNDKLQSFVNAFRLRKDKP